MHYQILMLMILGPLFHKMKNTKNIFIIIIFTSSLLFGSAFTVYSKDNGQDNKPYEKLNQTIENINSKGDQSILNARNSLKNLDNIYNALNKYYQKQSKKTGSDGLVDSRIITSQVKKESTYSRLSSATQAIKTFKAAQKKSIGDMNKLQNDLQPFIDAFKEYKMSLSDLIDAVSIYHNRNAQASPSAEPSSKRHNRNSTINSSDSSSSAQNEDPNKE